MGYATMICIEGLKRLLKKVVVLKGRGFSRAVNTSFAVRL
jgi:hypothetical protein